MRTALVTGGDRGAGALLAVGLADRGWAAEVIPANVFDDIERVRAAFLAAARRQGSPLLVLHALAAEPPEHHAPLASLDAAAWDAACEAPLRAALFSCVGAREVFGDQPGHLAFVLPILPLAGQAGQAAFGAALEGIRGMAKSAARRWGATGITVNCIAFLSAGEDSSRLGRWTPALARTVDARTDVAGVVELLTTAAGSVITGATIVVDGGLVMAP